MESEQNAISLERDQLKKEHLKLTHEMSLMQGMSSFVFFCLLLFLLFLWHYYHKKKKIFFIISVE